MDLDKVIEEKSFTFKLNNFKVNKNIQVTTWTSQIPSGECFTIKQVLTSLAAMTVSIYLEGENLKTKHKRSNSAGPAIML